MQLQEFISQTIVQLVRGALEAHNSIYKLQARVNPPISRKDIANPPAGYIAGFGPSPDSATIFVDFDVVVTAAEDSKSKGGLGIFVGGFGVGATGQSGTSSTENNRIRFSIPLALPTGWVKAHDLQSEETKDT